MRMFAGPNGSGKSTLKSLLPSALLGIYLNPDEIGSEIIRGNGLDVSSFGVTTSSEEVHEFFLHSPLTRTVSSSTIDGVVFEGGRILFPKIVSVGYLAAAATDFLRDKLVDQGQSFTFETVMSHPSKIAILTRARQHGFRTYLYFIATDNVEINISRVRARVDQGGHAVPEEKIRTRYVRSLDLLMDAIRQTDRAYIFDNSIEGKDRTWIAEITDGRVLEYKSDQFLPWFKRAILDKIATLTLLGSPRLPLC